MTNNFYVPEEWEKSFQKFEEEASVAFIIAYINDERPCYDVDQELNEALSKTQFRKIGSKKKVRSTDMIIKKSGKCSGEYLRRTLEKRLSDIDFRSFYMRGTLFIGVKSSRKKNPVIFRPGENAAFHDGLFTKALKKIETETLLSIGERIAGTDYAVCKFHKKGHPKFYNNREALEKAVSRAYAMDAFDHRYQAKVMLEGMEPK